MKIGRFLTHGSLLVGGLVAIASVAGLHTALSREDPGFGVTASTGGVLVPGLAAQDVFNLLVALPLLISCVWLWHRGSSLAALLVPGVLFYFVYTYAIYLVGAPFGPLFLVYAALVAASGLVVIGAMLRIEACAVTELVAPVVPARLVGGLLVTLGLLTVAQDSVGVLSTPSGVEPLARSVWTVDLALEAPAVFAGGVLLWRRSGLGYASALALLLQFGLTPLALAGVLAVEALVTGSTVRVGTSVGVLVFAIVCIAPIVWIALTMRRRSRSPSNGHVPSSTAEAAGLQLSVDAWQPNRTV